MAKNNGLVKEDNGFGVSQGQVAIPILFTAAIKLLLGYSQGIFRQLKVSEMRWHISLLFGFDVAWEISVGINESGFSCSYLCFISWVTVIVDDSNSGKEVI